MAGTVTITKQEFHSPFRPVRKYTFDWVSSAGGAVSGTESDHISGEILRVVFIPSGTAAPTANYDVTLEDEAGNDVLGGRGANLSATVTTTVKPGVAFTDGTTTSVAPIAIDDKLELVVANAGNAKAGTVILYVR